MKVLETCRGGKTCNLSWYPVSQYVGKVKNDGKECIKRIDPNSGPMDVRSICVVLSLHRVSLVQLSAPAVLSFFTSCVCLCHCFYNAASLSFCLFTFAFVVTFLGFVVRVPSNMSVSSVHELN